MDAKHPGLTRRGLVTVAFGAALGGQAAAADLPERTADTMAALAAIPRNACQGRCTTLGFYRPFDGGGGEFVWDGAASDPEDPPVIVKPAGPDATGRWRAVLDPAAEINLLRFGMRPSDGRFDNGNPVNTAMRWAAAQKGARFAFPLGVYYFASTVHVPANTALCGVGLQGCVWQRTPGPGNDYGHTLVLGDPAKPFCDGVQISDIWFLQAIGYENFDAAQWNPAAMLVQDSAHFACYGLRYSSFRRVLAWNMRIVTLVIGGADVTWDQCRFRGYWDNEARVPAGRLGGGTNHTYAIFHFTDSATHGHPETMSVVDCTLSGYKRRRTYAARSGDASRTVADKVQNVGPLQAVSIEAGEGLTFRGGLADTGFAYLFILRPRAGRPLLQTTIDMFLDSAGTAAVCFDNGADPVSAIGASIKGSINGENDGAHAILAPHDGRNPVPAVIDLDVQAQIRNHCASAIVLESAWRFALAGQISAWNWDALHADDPRMGSAMWVGGIARFGLIDHLTLGGGPHAEPIDIHLPPGTAAPSGGRDAGGSYAANQCAFDLSIDGGAGSRHIRIGEITADRSYVWKPGPGSGLPG